MLGMKDWLQNKATEYALKEYDKEFYELTADQQTIIYNKAIEDYKDYVAVQIDEVEDLLKYIGDTKNVV
jgi:hypothetical protein